MGTSIDDGQDLPVYTPRPPEWLPKSHLSADIGYPGYFPHYTGIPHDELTAENVKDGIIPAQPVAAEYISAQSTLNGALQAETTLGYLDRLMNEVFARRASQIPSIPQSTFKPPTRVTLNDVKRKSWFDDLADPDIPLYKLGKSIPHGAKGHDLLDLLFSKNVTVPRAIWFLRVFGANETAGLRNKPGYNPTQYSIEWSNIFLGYVKKTLAEISLPSAPRAGLNIKQKFKGILLEPDSRNNWVSRFTFCLELLRVFYAEGLVDKKLFLSWLVQQMAVCNLAQAAFVVRLAKEYLDDMMLSQALVRPFIYGCITKLSEIRSTFARDYLSDTDALIATLLQRLCVAIPDAFISPRLWRMHHALLCETLSYDVLDNVPEQQIAAFIQCTKEKIASNLDSVKDRNEALLFYNLPSLASAKLGTAVADIELLNAACEEGSLDFSSILPTTGDWGTSFGEKLDILLTWSVTPLQFGDHRPYLAVTVLKAWHDGTRSRASRRDEEFNHADDILQDHLFHWLDTSEMAADSSIIRAISVLFGLLIERELFSYPSYIQRLIARGETGLSLADEHESRHRKFLHWFPLLISAPDMASQRIINLYGARGRNTAEDAQERAIRNEIRNVLPSSGNDMPVLSAKQLLNHCSTFASAARYVQARSLKRWLIPHVRSLISSQDVDLVEQPFLAQTFSVTVELMAQTAFYESILELSLFMLENCVTLDVLLAATDTLHRFMTIWTSLRNTGTIAQCLYATHQRWKVRGIQRELLKSLVEFDREKALEEAARMQVSQDIASMAQALQPVSRDDVVVPAHLTDVLLLASDDAPEGPLILAGNLWIKFRGAPSWSRRVWDNVVAALRQIPAITSDVATRRAYAMRYSTFLWHVDQHLPNGLDEQVLTWSLHEGKNEVVALDNDTWSIVTVVILNLCIRGALKATTILNGLVYPSWKAAFHSIQKGEQTSDALLQTVNRLFHDLVLLEEGAGDLTSLPFDLRDIQALQTSRREIYTKSHFPYLCANVPLLVAMENTNTLSSETRAELARIRNQLCEDVAFRCAVFRNLDVVRNAFGRWNEISEDETLGDRAVEALKVVFCDVDRNMEIAAWSDETSLLSPWKISATAVLLQFMLRRMGKVVSQEAVGHAKAILELDQLSSKIFTHTLSSQEAYFIAQMTRGVGGAVAGKFINNGISCVANVLDKISPNLEGSALLETCSRAGELLRVLIYVAEPLRNEQHNEMPILDPEVQDRFFDVVCTKLEWMAVIAERYAENKDNSTSEHVQPTVLLAKFLQFDLGFRGVWTQKTLSQSTKVVNVLSRLVMSNASGGSVHLLMYPQLYDTLCYLLDEIPRDPKTATYDPFSGYPDTLKSELSHKLPAEYRVQLETLLPEVSPISLVTGLSLGHRDSSGRLIRDVKAVNRPWEWMENIGDPDKDSDKDEELKIALRTNHLVRNTGSLSLHLFSTRITGDSVIPIHPSTDAISLGAARMFEDGMSSESIFMRDWRESRLPGIQPRDLMDMQAAEAEVSAVVESPSRTDRRTPVGSSPASAPPSRKPSPAMSTSGLNRPSITAMETDSHPSSSSSTKKPGKRKAAPSDDDDDEPIAKKRPAKAQPKAKKRR